jgi:LytS/YehU family sensor histidine kinase
VKIDIKEQFRDRHVVPAALQMLIENAIKHNVVSRNRPLHIEIRTNGDQSLLVKNNLQPRSMIEPSTRIGLENIRKRYQLISGRDVEIRKTADSFEVDLPLLHLN